MDSTNYYKDKANRQFFKEKNKNENIKSDGTETKPEKWKQTAKGVGSDLVVGVLGGGVAAAAIGKPAFLVGLVISGYGHYTENKTLSALGLGMMASGTMSALNGNSKIPTLPERLKEFREELERKLYLDKICPKNKDDSVRGHDVTSKERSLLVLRPADLLFQKKEEIENRVTSEFLGDQINEIKNDAFSIEDDDDWMRNGKIY